MSIKSTLSIIVALAAIGAGSAAFAGEFPATGFVGGEAGTAYNELVFNYDAQGALHVAGPVAAKQATLISGERQERALQSYASSDMDVSAQRGAAGPLSDPVLTGGGSAGYNAAEEQSVYDR